MTKYTDFINYHLSMMVDDVRTGSYRQAISQVIRKGDVVVDVGCGSGILSFLACRAGAGHVYAIEREAVIEVANHRGEGEVRCTGGKLKHYIFRRRSEKCVFTRPTG